MHTALRPAKYMVAKAGDQDEALLHLTAGTLFRAYQRRGPVAQGPQHGCMQDVHKLCVTHKRAFAPLERGVIVLKPGRVLLAGSQQHVLYMCMHMESGLSA